MKKKRFWEALFLPPEEAKRRERVRKRKSYKYWKELFAFLKRNPSKEEILRRIYTELDKWKAFGFRTQSAYSEESLELLLEDLKKGEEIEN